MCVYLEFSKKNQLRRRCDPKHRDVRRTLPKAARRVRSWMRSMKTRHARNAQALRLAVVSAWMGCGYRSLRAVVARSSCTPGETIGFPNKIFSYASTNIESNHLVLKFS